MIIELKYTPGHADLMKVGHVDTKLSFGSCSGQSSVVNPGHRLTSTYLPI
jgi:hypothetical protein